MFRALRVFEENGKTLARLTQLEEQDLNPGNVTIEVHYSSVNYKDALAGTGKGRILKKTPLNPGIDAAGIVLKSEDSRFTKGQEVILTGCNTGEIQDGGYSEILRASADNLVKKPNGLTLKECMILGTAGFTAALARHRMEQNNQRPELGPIAITGASGGVGNFAIQIFSQGGYEVIAISGKPELKAELIKLGAHQVMSTTELSLGDRPLETVRFGGAIDNVGGKLLHQLLAHTQLWGNVASIGMAESPELHSTVMPLILRGVSLLGTSSNNTPMPLRQELWQKLAGPWKPNFLQEIVSHEIGLEQLPQTFNDILSRKTHGRVLVKVKKQ